MANRPYITAVQVRRSVLRQRWIEAQKRAEAEQAEQAARRRSSRTPKAPKTSTTSPKFPPVSNRQRR